MKKVMLPLLIVVIGLLAVFGTKIFKDSSEQEVRRKASDADTMKMTITTLYDNFEGYRLICGKEMKKGMYNLGFNYVCKLDDADYPNRNHLLKNHQAQFAVFTVNANILHGLKENFPGLIVTVLDESRGGDAIVSCNSDIQSLDDVKGRADLKVGLLKGSPNHTLTRYAVQDFGIPELLEPDNIVETNGSKDALNKCLNGEIDLALLWQPNVAQAVKKGKKVVYSSEDVKGAIVDVLLVDAKFANDHPKVVHDYLALYFRSLKKYMDNPDKHIAEILADSANRELTRDDAIEIIDSICWINLTDNAEQYFGITAPGKAGYGRLIESINQNADILRNDGEKIPDNLDTSLMINSKFINDLYFNGTKIDSSVIEAEDISSPFPYYEDVDWKYLEPIATLKIQNVKFMNATAKLTEKGRETLDDIVIVLKRYPSARIKIKGHTAPVGNADKNLQLSTDRAQAVFDYFKSQYKIHKNRMRVEGYGGTEPLKRKSSEGNRSYQTRCRRVEILLVK